MAQSARHVRSSPYPQLEYVLFAVPARFPWMVVPGKCTPSSQMTASITSLHLNGAALAGCGRARLEDNWATLDRWPFSDDQLDTFRRVAVKQNMSFLLW